MAVRSLGLHIVSRNRWLVFFGVFGLCGAMAVFWEGTIEQEARWVGPTTLEDWPAEIFYLDGRDIVRRGSPTVFAIRLPHGSLLSPHHFEAEKFEEPLSIEEWGNHVSAPLLINAGQYDEQFRHLGRLLASGKKIPSLARNFWFGWLASGPLEPSTRSRIVDLEKEAKEVLDGYGNLVQSMMLFDEQGRVRVRPSKKVASRLVVAEDSGGRLVVIHVQGAVTLTDLARWLMVSKLNLRRGMNLDGGAEAQLLLKTRSMELRLQGKYGTRTPLIASTPTIVAPSLPAIISVSGGGPVTMEAQ
ncbi:MAG: phosphodiester glycosidase family protein [Myxococcota bacterium]|nr:phosphodiester glycosidase family protein [Myxococcota bacterium]